MSFGFNNYLNNENYWNSLYKNDFSPVVGLPSSQPYKPPGKKIDQLIEEYIKISEYDTSAVKLRNDQSNKKSNEETSQNKTLSTQDKTNMNKFETCVRYAVNGLSKSDPGVSEPPLNTNIKNSDFGDDSGVVTSNKGSIMIGLADGAGGNRKNGIDPKIFSQKLLDYCVENVKNETIKSNEITKLACKAIHLMERRNVIGSGTLCLLSIDKSTNKMYSLNMGDSGFTLIRNGRIAHKSNPTMAGSSPKQFFVYNSRFSGFSTYTEEYLSKYI